MGENEKRVVITGLGAVTAIGLNLNETWNSLVNGRTGIGLIKRFDTTESITKIAAEISDEEFEQYSKKIIPRRSKLKMTRLGQYFYVATKEAVNDSGLNMDDVDKTRASVIVGATGSGYSSNDYHDKSNYILKGLTNAFSAFISQHYNFSGPNFSINTACAASAYAMGVAFDKIKAGQSDVIIIGGTDSMISKEGIAGFNELLALTENNEALSAACRPFDKKRDGFVMGEGAGVLIFESLEHALKRNARIYCEVLGYATTSEFYHIIAPQKDGKGMAETMKRCLENSGVVAEEVDYISAHGTSTYLNDLYETKAIKEVFNTYAYKVPISSPKSMMGHTLGAAGSFGAITVAKTMETGIITPTINYSEGDSECDLDYVPNVARNVEVNIAMSNAFGFGGHNASIIYKKYA